METPTSTYYRRETKKEKEKNQNIQVFVRCRPLNQQERKQNAHSVVDVNSDKREIVVRERPNDKVFTKTFTFDKAFPPTSKQVDVYKTVVGPLLDEVLTGYNCTVFAYGQTGTGKTFTMEGEKSPGASCRSWEDEPLAGIIPRCLHHLFEELGSQNVEYSVRVSFLELYNEELFDLLSPCDDASKLRLFEDPTRKGSVVIQGLEEVLVQTRDDVYEIMERGSEKRKTAATLMNAHSSRSHSVFSVTIHIKENTIDGEELLKTGKLNLVDLAGSENIGRSGAVDKRAREAGNINQSLLTLGRVITALVEKAPHVPYRESKLTRLLQDSLGGRTKTSIIATISPASCNLEETLSTLDYAHRAKNIMNRPEVNQKMTKKALIKEYTSEIERLRRDLVAAREKNGFYVDESNFRAMEAQINQSSKDMAERIANIEHLESQILRVTELFETTKKELNTTSLKLQTTENDLTITKTTLDVTSKHLTEVIQECNVQKYLVTEHAKKEKILSNQAHTVVAQADSAVSDVNGLHAKLERKRDIEAQNDEVATRFQSRHEDCLNQMVDNIKRLTADSKNFCVDFHKTLENKAIKQAAALSEVTELIAALTTGQTSKLEEILKNLNSDTKKNQEYIDLIIDLTCRFKNDSVGHQQNLEKSCLSFLNHITELLNENAALITSSTNHLLTKLEAHESSVRSHSISILDSIDKYGQKLKHDHNGYKNANTLMKLQLNEAKHKNNVVAAEFGKMVNIMNSWFEEQDVKINAIDHTQAEINERAELMASDADRFVVELRENVDLLQSSTVNDVQSTMEHNQENAKKLLSKTSEVEKEIEELKSEISSLNQQMLKDTEKQHTTIDSKLQDQSKTISSNLDILQSEIDTLEQDLRNSASKIEDLLKAQQVTAKSNVQGSQEQLAVRCALTEDTTGIMLQNFNQLREHVERFFTQEVRRDEPTGNTPQRRDFSYPRDLAATSPHDVLVQRFRAQQVEIEPPPLSLTEESDKESTATSPTNSMTDLSNISAESSDKFETDVKENTTLPSSKSLKSKGKKVVCKNPKVKQRERKPLMAQNTTA